MSLRTGEIARARTRNQKHRKTVVGDHLGNRLLYAFLALRLCEGHESAKQTAGSTKQRIAGTAQAKLAMVITVLAFV